MQGMKKSGSKEISINYIPERNKPISGELRMAAASIPEFRAQVSFQRWETLWGWGEIARLSLDDWVGGLNWEPGRIPSSKSILPNLPRTDRTAVGEVLVRRGQPHGPGHFHSDWIMGPSKSEPNISETALNPSQVEHQPDQKSSNVLSFTVFRMCIYKWLNGKIHISSIFHISQLVSQHLKILWYSSISFLCVWTFPIKNCIII